MIYDYYKERERKPFKGKLILGILVFAVLIILIAAFGIYMEVLQLNEIGGYSGIYIKNLLIKLLFSSLTFIAAFTAISVTNIFIRRNLKEYFEQNNLPPQKLPSFIIAAIVGIITAFINNNTFYLKALGFLNAVPFNSKDPLFLKDIGFYIFQRPFLISIYDFISGLWIFIIVYTIAYYLIVLFSVFNNLTWQDLKIKSIIRHNLVNIALFFIIKAFSYQFLKQDLLYSNVVGVTGASYVDVHIWMNYFAAAPFILIAIVLVSFYFIIKGGLKKAGYTIAVFPAIWVLVTISAYLIQSLYVTPNEFNLESQYIKYNIEKTREAFNLDKIKNYDFPSTQELTPDIINRNIETKNNIRVVDYASTLISDIQLQSNTAFYTFNNGDIINYKINGKEVPVFITAREIGKIPDNSPLSVNYKYTHGYGVVINPINKITSEGQVDFILSGLVMKSSDPSLKATQPRIYYGELTKNRVIVKASNNLNEIDYDGNSEIRYEGKGGIKLNLLNRLLFAIKYGDFNMLLISGYSNDATLLLNREIVERAQKPVPFLTVDKDPYIILTGDGRLKWVLDGYTSSSSYPYSQGYNGINYIRNSVKIIVDAYDGDVSYYIIDKSDPLIMAYSKAYPGVFKDEPIPLEIAEHFRYPEALFMAQTEMLKRYHMTPEEVSNFYTKQDLWDIAKYSTNKETDTLTEIEAYYNMIKLPEDIGKSEELILMRPFTPAGESKHNMVSWLAVRNSYQNYGEMILFKFPRNTNIFGPNQVEVKINQIDKVSSDMTLWGQSGSDAYKGNLLVIPIENSILYVEPIYIRAAGGSSTPEVKEIIVGYQKGDEFKYGIGKNLDAALDNLFAGMIKQPGVQVQPTPAVPPVQPGITNNAVNEKTINDILQKYDQLKKQIDELGGLINSLKK
jgi:uncharacterized membrane protein (UPF0182 family)